MLGVTTSAEAHGGEILVAMAAGLALAFGAACGAIAAFREQGRFPTLPHTLAAFLAVGLVGTGALTRSFEGLVLFVMFGGFGGVVPLILGYFIARGAIGGIRKLCRKRSPPVV